MMGDAQVWRFQVKTIAYYGFSSLNPRGNVDHSGNLVGHEGGIKHFTDTAECIVRSLRCKKSPSIRRTWSKLLTTAIVQ